MILGVNYVALSNLIFCILIVFVSFIGFRKRKDYVVLYFGTAFILLALTYVIQLIIVDISDLFLIIIPAIAYLIIIYVIYRSF
jgi:hypothetical protein